MSVPVCLRARALGGLALWCLVSPPSVAMAQTTPTFKVAWYNIQSGKGEPALAGHTSNFVDTTNCTDFTKPINGWATGLIQSHLTTSVGGDPKMVAIGLAEAWASTCGSPGHVRAVLGWKSASSERNGVAIVAKYGFAGPEDWLQLDTSLNPNPADTMWVLRIPVCLDAACSQSINTFSAHWYASDLNKNASYDRQAVQTVAFLQRAGGTAPHILIADLNAWEGTRACGQDPSPFGLQRLRDAGYVDAWPLLHGGAEGFTGMINRAGCGSPVGYGWKRPDYTWSLPSYLPVSIARFGVVPAGDEAPSDHYGLITEFPFPGPIAKVDTTAPVVSLANPTEGQTFTGGSLLISATATDDLGVARVDIVEDGVVTSVLTASPYQRTSTIAAIDGAHTIEARAYDAAGNTSTDVRHILVSTSSGGPLPSPTGEIVLYAKNASVVTGNWQTVEDPQAAGGARMWNPDAAAPKLSAPLAAPANYFELTFNAEAGRGYRVWIRGRADRDYWGNDSVYVQFTGSVTATGVPAYRIGSTDGTWLGIEDCSGCGLSAWGWNDNGYGAGVLGPLVYFASSGAQTIRVQQREDGISLDQIVLSPVLYLTSAPGVTKQDALILPLTTSAPIVSTTEIIVTAVNATTITGGWARVADATAANGVALGNPDAGAAKIATASASPTDYVELTFQADAGTAYRLWMRGKAERDYWANDSVHVQFSGSVDASSNAVSRIGSTISYVVNLEDDANAGVSGWGWQDNGYGANVLGPVIRFQASGTQTVRVQTREDGFRFDQIVLSAQMYLTTAPGPLKNDATIVK